VSGGKRCAVSMFVAVALVAVAPSIYVLKKSRTNASQFRRPAPWEALFFST
jgi:hypothetical protein